MLYKADATLESILKVREVILDAMLSACYEVIDALVSDKVCQLSNISALDDQPDEGCRYIIIGLYLEWLTNTTYFPRCPGASTLDLSVHALQEQLCKVTDKSHEMENRFGRTVSAHKRGFKSVNLGLYIANSVGNMPSPVLEFHRKHMAVQAGLGKS